MVKLYVFGLAVTLAGLESMTTGIDSLSLRGLAASKNSLEQLSIDSEYENAISDSESRLAMDNVADTTIERVSTQGRGTSLIEQSKIDEVFSVVAEKLAEKSKEGDMDANRALGRVLSTIKLARSDKERVSLLEQGRLDNMYMYMIPTKFINPLGQVQDDGPYGSFGEVMKTMLQQMDSLSQEHKGKLTNALLRYIFEGYDLKKSCSEACADCSCSKHFRNARLLSMFVEIGMIYNRRHCATLDSSVVDALLAHVFLPEDESDADAWASNVRDRFYFLLLLCDAQFESTLHRLTDKQFLAFSEWYLEIYLFDSLPSMGPTRLGMLLDELDSRSHLRSEEYLKAVVGLRGLSQTDLKCLKIWYRDHDGRDSLYNILFEKSPALQDYLRFFNPERLTEILEGTEWRKPWDSGYLDFNVSSCSGYKNYAEYKVEKEYPGLLGDMKTESAWIFE